MTEDAATTVLVHSPLTSAAAWGDLPSVLRGRGHQVAVVDVADDDAPPFAARFVARAALQVREQAGDRPVLLVGHSGAGYLLPLLGAARRAARARVAGYVFLDAALPPARPTSRLDLMRAEMPDGSVEHLASMLAAGGTFPDWTDTDCTSWSPTRRPGLRWSGHCGPGARSSSPIRCPWWRTGRTLRADCCASPRRTTVRSVLPGCGAGRSSTGPTTGPAGTSPRWSTPARSPTTSRCCSPGCDRRQGTRATASRCGLRPSSSGTRCTARAASSTTSLSTGSAEALAEVGQRVGHPLDTDQVLEDQPGCRHLLADVVGAVRVAGERPREQRRQQPVDLGDDDQLPDLRVLAVEPLGQDAVQPRRPARDHRGHHEGAGPAHPPGLSQCLYPVRSTGQVVQRPEQQHRVDRRVRQVEGSRVGHR
jgi:pimeloyl-ACP methyl ester carboxylesterase